MKSSISEVNSKKMYFIKLIDTYVFPGLQLFCYIKFHSAHAKNEHANRFKYALI